MTIEVKIKAIDDNAVMPKFSNDTDAGADLTVTSIEKKGLFKVVYKFGIAIQIPKNTYAALVPRSSIYKTLQVQSNSYGVIDSGYRGELMMVCYRIPLLSKLYKVGERACQLIVRERHKVVFNLANVLTVSKRGKGGFGSTGV